MAYRQHAAKRFEVMELNITAFMNLMVVLVPFLLMTAVFSHLTILDLNLPPPDTKDAQQNDEPPLEFRVTIRPDALILSDNRGGLIKRIARVESGHNYLMLRQTLKSVKARFPEHTALTILSEAKTPYDDLIQTMDSARSYPTLYEGQQVFGELFPDISIGDTPK
jgi:biopolymer transport protein ExbD